MSLSIQEHCSAFYAFTKPYLTGKDDGPIRLKVEHSLRVFEHVRTLTEEEDAIKNDEEVARAALLAALYHDCGRFPQYSRYHTFQDATSANHALLGLRAIRAQGFLREEKKHVRHLASTAVFLHNRYALPPRLHPKAAIVTHMVRDADKLDILRVMVQHLDGALPDKDAVLLSVQDKAGRWTPQVLEDVLAGRVARYTDLRYVNDFRLLLGTWLYELRFQSTRAALQKSGLMDAVLEGLPSDEPVQRAVRHLRAYLQADPRNPQYHCQYHPSVAMAKFS